MLFTNEKMLESVVTLTNCEEKGMLGYAIARNRQKLAAEVQDYSRKRDELLHEHGVDIGDGKYQLPPENAARFFEALRPYAELTVDVPVMMVAPEVFYGGNLTSSTMFNLSWMVKEET